MNFKFKRIVAYILTAVFILGATGQMSYSAKGERKKAVTTMEEVLAEIPNQIEAKATDYIIMTNEDGCLGETLEKIEITKETAEILQEKFDDVIIEEDSLVKGSSQYQNKKKKTKISAKKINYEWNMGMINANSKKEKPLNSNSKVKVALIDSGIDRTKDINVKERKDFLLTDSKLETFYDDLSGHGTSIAGIIASKDNNQGITGINSNIELYSARVLDGENKAPISRIIEAIDWAIDKDVNIINLSLGIKQYSAALEQAIRKAYNAGILIIASAGNNGPGSGNKSTVEYPAAFKEVMAVGAIDTDGEVSSTSSVGEEVEIMAPGEQVLSTGAFDGVIVCGGTSIAVPHVVGVASMLWQKDMSCKSDFIRELLKASARNTNGVSRNGEGIVDLDYAMSIYDQFKQTYESISKMGANENIALGFATEFVAENKNEANEYTDVDYVEGRWKRVDHISITDESANVGYFTATQLKYIKAGSVFNDIVWPGYGRETANSHPNMHANYNYIASYMYVAKLARAYYDDSSNSKTAAQLVNGLGWPFSAVNADRKTELDADLKSIPWSKLSTNADFNTLGLKITDAASLSNRNKSFIILGIALHIVQDSFAHNAYTKNSSGTYVALNHCKNHTTKCDTAVCCDSVKVAPKRLDCADCVGFSAVATFHYYKDQPSLWEYEQDYASFAGSQFRMYKLLDWAKQVDKNMPTSYVNCFTKMTP